MTRAEPTATDLLMLPGSVGQTLADHEITDLLSYFDPDAVFVLDDGENQSVVNTLRDQDVIVIAPGQDDNATGIYTMRDVDVIIVSNFTDLSGIRAAESKDLIDPETETFVVSDLLDLHVDREQLNTSLDGGDNYRDALGDNLSGSYTHISTQLPASYSRDWEDLHIQGGAPPDSQGQPPIPCLTLRTDGYVTVETLSSQQLGLKAIDNVGPTMADRLRENNFSSADTIVSADLSELQEVNGIGEKRANQITNAATAMTNGRVVRTSDSPVPGEDPIFIDIETDGLNATITWLIGVQDGVNGKYISFLNENPDEPGKAVRDFMMWVKANAKNRTFIAWNGWGFDYEILRDHIVEYCPEYLDTWESLSKRDLLRWAIEMENAVLPGRTNKLEHVAEGLGWETDSTGLSGKAVGEAYRHWVQERTPEAELDWERHCEYCQDDVESLAHIYKEIRNEGRLAAKGGGTESVAETTDQGTLAEW
ncbi:ribonuclease H-like domain-containing protein [Salinibaculum rarum]|uniref:ribonuclease H-like domain-containing protein n=1 Tax=Salinibaculum rarum TaxID=3058903 RepID=UPI00265F0052|nr:ribonuclease H-like domain-containing protein [Salinibaculum sp. KK48]